MSDADPEKLSEAARGRVERTHSRVETLLEEARSLLRNRLPEKVSFELPGDPPEERLSSTERAQIVTLIQRYALLADPPPVELGRKPDRHYIANLAHLRQVLSGYQPFIHGSSSLYYTRLHTVWSRRLSGDGGRGDLSIRVIDGKGREVTPDYRRWLDDRKKAIAHVLGELDYSYVYDGVLQHEKPAHSDRFLRDWESGEVNHTLLAHVVSLGFIRQMLWPYASLARTVALPEMGGL